MRALTQQGYTTPTPIQAQSIPIVKAGHDLLGIAQTGTGKTAAFALPTLDYLMREDKAPPKRSARVLVLAPTRELARQISSSFRSYGQYFKHFSVATIFGGASVRGQIKTIVGGNDVIVATPGRLIDLIDQKALHLSDVEVLILDEADQMMDMGFIHPLKKIVSLLPKERQTLFFSATMPKSISKLANEFLTNPKKVSVAPAATTAERVEQHLYRVNKNEKQALLILTLNEANYDRALVFSRTKHGADRIVKKLAAAGISAAALHGNKSQGQRQRILQAFKEGKTNVLVATDIAARGIDIDGITHVINYDLPNVPDQYVHRIGRTARAGRSGLAISFCAPDEKPYLKDIQKLIGQTLNSQSLPDDFNKAVSQISKLKPVPVKKDEGGYERKDDPRRDKKRVKRFRKNAEQAKADMVIDDTEASKPKRQKSTNPDGSRAERKQKRFNKTKRSHKTSEAKQRHGSKPKPNSDNKDQKQRSSQGEGSASKVKNNSFKKKPRNTSSANPNGKSPKARQAPNGGGRRGGDAPPKRRQSKR